MKYPVLTYTVIYLCVVSLISIGVTVSDKIRAGKGKWRTPEAVLLTWAALGGSLAMYIAMVLIRHKTKHIKFMLGLPMIMAFQTVVILWLLHRYSII